MNKINSQIVAANEHINNTLTLFDALGIKQGDLIRVVDDMGKIKIGFYKNREIKNNQWKGYAIYLVVRLYKIKKDGSPSKIKDVACDPVLIAKIDKP